MSNLGKELGIDTESSQEYNQLLNQQLALELTKNTNPIIGVLAEDENTLLYEMMDTTRNNGFGIFLEDIDDIQKDTLATHILDSKNNQVCDFRLSILEEGAEKRTLFDVEAKTFAKLKELTLDPQVCKANIESKLRNAI
jgi:transcriptional antiterminator